MIPLRSAALIAGCLLLAGPAWAQEPAPLSVRYKCDNKQSLQVDYSTVLGKAPRAVITAGKAPKSSSSDKSAKSAKASWTMNQTAPAPDARYEDAKNRMGWSTQGRAGQLTDLKTNKSIHCTEYASSR